MVGGTVRDLLLGKPPKDYDVLTTAHLANVKQLFRRSFLVGKRFRIAHVLIGDSRFEVSSFHTAAPEDEAGSAAEASRKRARALDPTGLGPAVDERLRRCQANALRRDFTVNGLLYDPFAQQVLDFVGGLRDLERREVRCIVTAEHCFSEDPARMLRAVRVAARSGFALESRTGNALRKCAGAVATIPLGRLRLELNALLAHGAAAPSVLLLWRYGLLDLLLPSVAAHLQGGSFPRQGRALEQAADTSLMFALLRAFDEHTCHAQSALEQAHWSGATEPPPLDAALWTALIAAPLAAGKAGGWPAAGRAEGKAWRRATTEVLASFQETRSGISQPGKVFAPRLAAAKAAKLLLSSVGRASLAPLGDPGADRAHAARDAVALLAGELASPSPAAAVA